MLVYTFDSLGSYFTFLAVTAPTTVRVAREYCMYCKHYTNTTTGVCACGEPGFADHSTRPRCMGAGPGAYRLARP